MSSNSLCLVCLFLCYRILFSFSDAVMYTVCDCVRYNYKTAYVRFRAIIKRRHYKSLGN